MTQSPCKHDKKSKSHPGMKLAPVRIFSCKHPLSHKIANTHAIYIALLAGSFSS